MAIGDWGLAIRDSGAQSVNRQSSVVNPSNLQSPICSLQSLLRLLTILCPSLLHHVRDALAPFGRQLAAAALAAGRPGTLRRCGRCHRGRPPAPSALRAHAGPSLILPPPPRPQPV